MSKKLLDMQDPKNWEKVFDTFTDGIYITNADGLTLQVNRAYEEITGLNAENLIGKYMTQIVQEGYLSTSITQKVIETKKPVSIEQEIKNGKKVALNGFPIFDQDEILMVVSFVRDVTVLNKIEEDLKHSRFLIDQYQQRLNKMQKTQNYVASSQRGFHCPDTGRIRYWQRGGCQRDTRTKPPKQQLIFENQLWCHSRKPAGIRTIWL